MTRRFVRTAAALAAVAGLAGAGVLLAQTQPAFRTETRLVVLYATVTNGRGEIRTGLDRSAFRVFENGKAQPITLFRRDDVPVSVGLLIDNSGSMRPVRARVEAAALAFVRASNPDDEVFVVNFADHPKLDVAFTRDIHTVEAGIARVDAIGGTALRDAVRFAEQYLREHATRDRRALLIVTDGRDNSSETTVEQIAREAERSDTVLFGIGLFADDHRARQGRQELEDLTARSGGVAYYPKGIDQVGAVALDLAKQIREQYTIGYTPLNTALDGSYREVEVKASSPDKSERLSVRTRRGYRAQ